MDEKLKRGKWSDNKVDDIIQGLKNRKMLQALPKIIEIAGMAGAAYFAYDLYTTKEPERTVAQHTTFWWVQIFTNALLGKKVGPVGKMITSLGVTLFGDAFLGLSSHVDSLLWQIMGADEFNVATFSALGEMMSTMEARVALNQVLRKTAGTQIWKKILGKTILPNVLKIAHLSDHLLSEK